MEVEDRIVDYIRRSIAERGGTARRLSRIQMEMEAPYVEDAEFGAAIGRLMEAGRIVVEPENDFGFIYVRIPDRGT